MRISDWSSDVCSSDLDARRAPSRPEVQQNQLPAEAVKIEEAAILGQDRRQRCASQRPEMYELISTVPEVGGMIVSMGKALERGEPHKNHDCTKSDEPSSLRKHLSSPNAGRSAE